MNSQMLPRAKTEGYWNNMEQLSVCLVLVSGNPEAEGNGRFHQRPQYDRDQVRRWSKAQVFATEVGSNEMELPGHSPRGWRFLMIFA
jgi:hypothetical protein